MEPILDIVGLAVNRPIGLSLPIDRFTAANRMHGLKETQTMTLNGGPHPDDSPAGKILKLLQQHGACTIGVVNSACKNAWMLPLPPPMSRHSP